MILEALDLGRIAHLPDAPCIERIARPGAQPAFVEQTDRRGDRALLDQRDLLDHERPRPLAFAVRREGIAPHGGEIRAKGEDTLTGWLVDREPVGRAAPLIVIVGIGERARPAIPVGLQRVGHETIGRSDMHVPVTGGIGLVLGPLDLTMTEAVGLLQTRGNFLLYGQMTKSRSITARIRPVRSDVERDGCTFQAGRGVQSVHVDTLPGKPV